MANKLNWSETFEINWLDVDLHGKVKLSSIFNYLQEVAWRHAASLGFGYEDVKKHGQYWVVARMLLKLNYYPGWRQKIKVETWPSGVEGLWAFREYRLIDEDDQVVGNASSSWIVLDAKTHKPVASEVILGSIPHINPVSATGETPERIIVKSEMETIKNHTVQFSEVDFHQHVNNSVYMDWVADVLSKQKLSNPAKRISVNYMAEARLDEMVLHKSLETTEGLIIKGEKEDGTVVFIARLSES